MFDNKTNKEEHAAEYKIINCKNVMYKTMNNWKWTRKKYTIWKYCKYQKLRIIENYIT